MSSASYITARDLFLAHHWKRYIAFDHVLFEGYDRGRVAAKDGNILTLQASGAIKGGPDKIQVAVQSWASVSLREPKAAESAPSAYEVISIGDWIGVNKAGAVVLFAPCSQRGATAVQEGDALVTKAKAWASFLSGVRQFFSVRAFTEMTTPTLAPSPGTEPFLDPLAVMIEADGRSIEKFLITSPEFHLKKALSAGLPRVFEIAKCFRNKEGGGHHRVEFHMLEWYRSFASLHEIAQDVEALIQHFSPHVKLVRMSMTEVFKSLADVQLLSTTTREDLAGAANRVGVRTTADDDFNDIFHRIFLEKIEPSLSRLTSDAPVMLSGYPPSMAALARVGPDGFADRFEVYWHGLELCNAFHELNDPSENRRRFDADNEAKRRSGREAVPLDDDLLKSFELGVPPAGGVALGLERLFMALYQVADIDGVRPFQS